MGQHDFNLQAKADAIGYLVIIITMAKKVIPTVPRGRIIVRNCAILVDQIVAISKQITRDTCCFR